MYSEELKDETLGLELVLTMRCNANCSYCYQKDAPITPDMSKETLDKIFERISTDEYYRKYNITFFGGEPTLAEENIIYFLEKFKTFDKKKIVSFMMPTNAKDVESLLRIKKIVNKMRYEMHFTLSNKEGLDLKSIPKEIINETSFTFVLTPENHEYITEEYIQFVRSCGIRSFTVKPDMYRDLSSITYEELKRVLQVVAKEKGLFSMNMIDPDATACVLFEAHRATILSDGEMGLCTRVTMGCFDGKLGHIDDTTFREAVIERFKQSEAISETGMCICKTNDSLKNGAYMNEIIEATDGVYNSLIMARD